MQATYFKKTWSVALPIIFVQLIGTITSFIGMAFLATLGHDVLAASALLYSIQTMIFVIGMSPLFALSVLISRALGKGEQKEIGNILQQSWLLALILGAIIFVLYSYVGPILHAFGQAQPLIVIIKPYFYIARWGMPAILISVACSQFLLGVGKQKLVAVISCVQTLILIVASYTFVLGHFGVHKYGVAGWGIAFTISAWLNLGMLAIILYWQHDFKKFHIFHVHMKNGLQHLKDLFHFGWPIAIQTGGELLSFGFVTIMVGWLGTTSLAAIQVVTQFLMIMVIPAYGFSTAAGILVGHSMGAKKFTQARAFGYTSVIICASTIALFGILLNLFPTSLAHIFLSPSEPDYVQILSLVKTIFIIAAISQVFDSIRNSLTGALRGLLDMRFAMIIGLISIWILRVPVSYILAFKFHMGVVGIALGSVVGMIIGAAVIYWRWWSKTRVFND